MQFGGRIAMMDSGIGVNGLEVASLASGKARMWSAGACLGAGKVPVSGRAFRVGARAHGLLVSSKPGFGPWSS